MCWLPDFRSYLVRVLHGLLLFDLERALEFDGVGEVIAADADAPGLFLVLALLATRPGGQLVLLLLRDGVFLLVLFSLVRADLHDGKGQKVSDYEIEPIQKSQKCNAHTHTHTHTHL